MRATGGWRAWVRTPEGRFYAILLAIALVGLAARVAYVLATGDLRIPSDGSHYHARAAAVANGQGFVNPLLQELFRLPAAPPDASNPPGWTVVLAGVTKAGVDTLTGQKLFATLVGTATVVMSGLAGRAAFGRRAGLVAAAIVAAYPNVWLYERELMSEPLALLGVATCVWLSYRFLARPSQALALALGAIVGLLALTRAETAALGLLLVVPLVWSVRDRRWQERVRWIVLAGLTAALLIAPWATYNTRRFDRTVLLSTGLGITMRAGSCDATYSGEFLGYYRDFCGGLGDDVSPNQAEAEAQMRELALDYMGDHLDRLPVVVAARLGRTFNVYRPFQQARLESERGGTPLWVEWLGLAGYWALVPLAVVGAIDARRRAIRIYPLLAFPAVVALAVAGTIGIVRYRVPAEVPLAILAAAGIDHLWRTASARRTGTGDADQQAARTI